MSLLQKVCYVTPTDNIAVTPQTTGGGPLGSGLFITPRSFTFNTYAGPGIYNLPDEGLVAIFALDPAYGTPPTFYSDAGYRVVTKSDGTMSLMPFAQAMAALCIYGGLDDGQTLAQKQATAKGRFLEVQCGDAIAFTLGCAAQVGITARQVEMVTAETPNNVDDGHVLCEMRDATGAWKLFDIANDMAFADSSGNLLSLDGVIDAGVVNCTPVRLARSECANPGYSGTTVPFREVWESELATPAMVSTWQQRIFQIPAINNATTGVPTAFMPAGTESRQSYIEGLGYTVETRSAFDAQFYA